MLSTKSSTTSILKSSVTRKILAGITGLGLFVFIIEHLLGNLLLLKKDPAPYNQYAHNLFNLGWLLIVLEVGLLALFAIHIFNTLSIRLSRKKARPIAYHKTGRAGEPGRKTLPALYMAVTGSLLLVFVLLHLKTFKYGPWYTMTVNGVEMRDLHRLVTEVFHKPGYVFWYVLAMGFLGFHLSYGFWSAFQSLGLFHPRLTPALYKIGYVLAILITLGFISIPIWIYFTGGS
jgi:succinate dehydrogenase / fumarate reductase cytochrome b subunit